jgi:two-component system sensor histidine kinase KdpD
MATMHALNASTRRLAVGVSAGLAGHGVVVAILLPFRASLSLATPALAFVVPVVVGVVVGGFLAGVVVAGAGFILYDVLFIPPYNTLSVGAGANWLALAVYLAVVLLVTRTVTSLHAARDEAHRREQETGRLYELSQALIGDRTLAQLLDHITDTVQAVFAPQWTALLLPEGATDVTAPLVVAARAGQELSAPEMASMITAAGRTHSLGLGGGDGRVEVALVAANRPVGLLVLEGVALAGQDRALLGTFANQAALAVERAQLRERALRTELLEEIDRWRGALMGAVSHDLRTPLASVKTAVSSLRGQSGELSDTDRGELLELIEVQSDRLARLVTNLLDMTRIDSGALRVRAGVVPLDELVAEALTALSGLVSGERITVDAPADLPFLEIDHVLVSQVLANLLENAARLSPPESTIAIAARPAPRQPGAVEIAVSDEGPGIDPAERTRIFEMFSQRAGAGRAGLGLAIAKSFVEAHGGSIWIDPDTRRGARVVFTVPAAAEVPHRV